VRGFKVLTPWLRRAVAFNLAVVVGTIIGMLILYQGDMAILALLPVGLAFGYAAGAFVALPALVLLHRLRRTTLLAHVGMAVLLAAGLAVFYFLWQRSHGGPSPGLMSASVQTFILLAVAMSAAAALYWALVYRSR
jgi:hypothetical protein